MGLDWIARPRMEGQLEVDPLETLGFKRLNRDQPETIEQYRKIYQSHRDAATRGETNSEHKAFWTRPFDEILDERLASDKPVFVEGMGEQVPSFITGGSFAVPSQTSWRGKRIGLCGLPGDVVERSYGDNKDESRFTVAGAKAYADELDAYANMPDRLAHGVTGTIEQKIEALREGAAFLRFWAENGHEIWCWW